MDITSEMIDGVMLMRIEGRLDASTSPDLEAKVKNALADGCSKILFDMEKLSYISSAGLRVVLITGKQTKAAKGGFAIFALQPTVKEVFDISGFANILKIRDDLDAAREALSS